MLSECNEKSGQTPEYQVTAAPLLRLDGAPALAGIGNWPFQ